MLEIFKEKQEQQPKSAGEISEPVAEKQVEIDDIAIHSMPERFRSQTVKMDSAKTTGMAIIVGGIGVLIVVSGLLYYYLIRKPDVVVTTEQPAQTENTQPAETAAQPQDTGGQQNLNTASGTLSSVLPTDNTAASSTLATSTEDIFSPGKEKILNPGIDSDNDGLIDKEEILLGTGTSTPDTDADGYADGAELLNLYNPAGAGKITADKKIAVYENKTFSYTMLYPSAWKPSFNGGDDSVMFKSDDNQFIQVIAQPNANKQTLDAWYMEQLNVSAINSGDRLSGSVWQGIKSVDGLTVYLMGNKGNYIFSLTYNPGESSTLDYANIFRMMVKSFRL